jgi:hypothetical protein
VNLSFHSVKRYLSYSLILIPHYITSLSMNLSTSLHMCLGVYYSRLGDYVPYDQCPSSITPTQSPNDPLDFPNRHLLFTIPSEVESLQMFRAELERVRGRIVQRNAECPLRQKLPYWYLHPDNIPQSINI